MIPEKNIISSYCQHKKSASDDSECCISGLHDWNTIWHLVMKSLDIWLDCLIIMCVTIICVLGWWWWLNILLSNFISCCIIVSLFVSCQIIPSFFFSIVVDFIGQLLSSSYRLFGQSFPVSVSLFLDREVDVRKVH